MNLFFLGTPSEPTQRRRREKEEQKQCVKTKNQNRSSSCHQRPTDDDHNQRFFGESVNLDGSMRGFELFTVSFPNNQTSVYLFLNNIPDREGVRDVFRALERFIFD